MRKNNIFNEEFYKRLSYIQNNYSIEDKLLKNIRYESLLNDRPITINSDEGKLLQFLIKSHNINNILEIGTLFGYSTIWMARSLNENGKITTIEKEEYNKKIAERNFKLLENNLNNKINILLGDATTKLNELINSKNKYDMIFIDADKKNYFNYLKLSEKLVKKNGLIVADNTFLSSSIYSPYLPDKIKLSTQKEMKKFHKKLQNKEKYFSIMLNTEEGLNISIKLF